ncbi:hypothetical protein ACFOLD_11300 [Kocuria carniphila]
MDKAHSYETGRTAETCGVNCHFQKSAARNVRSRLHYLLEAAL